MYVYHGVGFRDTVNAITAFVDASNVYGSNDKLAKNLRVGGNGGKIQPHVYYRYITGIFDN